MCCRSSLRLYRRRRDIAKLMLRDFVREQGSWDFGSAGLLDRLEAGTAELDDVLRFFEERRNWARF